MRIASEVTDQQKAPSIPSNWLQSFEFRIGPIERNLLTLQIVGVSTGRGAYCATEEQDIASNCTTDVTKSFSGQAYSNFVKCFDETSIK